MLVFSGDAPGPDVQDGVGDALEHYAGTWTIEVDRQLVGGWCQLRLTTEGFDRTLLLAPYEQSRDQVAEFVRQAIASRESKRSSRSAPPASTSRVALEQQTTPPLEPSSDDDKDPEKH